MAYKNSLEFLSKNNLIELLLLKDEEIDELKKDILDLEFINETYKADQQQMENEIFSLGLHS